MHITFLGPLAALVGAGMWSAPGLGDVPPLPIDARTPICMPGKSRVHETALREWASVFPNVSTGALNVLREDSLAAGSVFVGLIGESASIQDLIRRGAINLHNVPPDLDAYEILGVDGTLCVLGNTPRGMLHAVYKMQELVREGRPIPRDIHIKGTFHIRQRYFHQRFDKWPGEPADLRYISHLGASHCLLAHDWQGSRRLMQGYVTSDIFPDAVDAAEVKAAHRDMRKLIGGCADYGIEPCLWLTELPCQGGPWVPEESRRRFLARFPGEVLSDCGTYQGKVLCFSHPKVQAFYRDLLARFFNDFPAVSTIFLFGLDSGGEFCSPDLCPRCKGISKFEQRDRLIRFLIDEGQKVRPALRVLTTGWGWSGSTDEFLERQKRLPSASGLYLAAEVDGWQPERQLHDFLRNARAVCRQRDQTFVGYDDLHWGDDTVHDLNDIQDYPLGIGAKIRRWHDLHADGVFDHWGGFNNDISCNSVACREFFLNPLADPETVCRRIAARQFGDAAGALAFEAWKSLERAHAILSNHCTFPPAQWPGWYPGRTFAPVPDGFAQNGVQGGEVARPASGMTYNPPELSARLQGVGDAWRLAYPHYVQAAERMHAAAEKADDSPVFYSFWWSGRAKTPTRREHLRRQGIYIESMGLAGREIGIHFSLNALYEKVGRNATAYEEQAEALLREDVEACKAAADYFDRLKNQGDDRNPRRDWAEQYRAKARKIEEYLARRR